ncbi:2-oxoacid:acceptor oxidoreductase subunit alpha [Desulfoferula mesophila]|uniref:2-oxoglutarate ferredoxin oxidoreductase subunit alpha n=1 Tax=Desulfoferula mesophila TaxID=3058419 RepID=A0AAU9F3B7_9BACT|nr:2-oxoglutarate ferredoxin oxidoreductase subunit alpha [Desulfoferula mesophilus]
MALTVEIVQGNEACVKGALAAGCRFFAGYPITPATEIAELMALRLPEHNGAFVQMEDELGSINAVVGAAWGGMKACTATTGPGFSLMQEGIGYAAMTETPCVIIDVQRGGPATGQPTMPSQQDVMQAKYGSHGDYEIIALCPSSVQESFELTVKAFNLAERFRVPVIVLSDEIVGHTREKLRIPAEVEAIPRTPPAAPPDEYKMYRPGPDGLLDGMPSVGQGYNILVESQAHGEDGNRKGNDIATSAKVIEHLCSKITGHAQELTDIVTLECDEAEVLVVAYGSVVRSAKNAVRQARAQGIKAGLVQLRILWPFPDEALVGLASGVRKVLVPEMNVGKISREVQRVLGKYCEVISLPALGGELHTPTKILKQLGS